MGHCNNADDGADGNIGPYLFIRRILMRARNLVPFLSVSSVCSLQGTYREEETAKRYDENAQQTLQSKEDDDDEKFLSALEERFIDACHRRRRERNS